MDSRWDKKLNFKTQSALVFPLVQGKRLVGILQFLNKNDENKFSDSDVYMGKELASVMGRTMVRLDAEDIEDKIRTIERSAPHNLSIDGVYEKLQKSLLHVFDAQRVTIYSLDVKKNELCTKTITGEINTKEIRIPVDSNSIAGCVASIKKTANILDVYNPKLLEKFHPKASFDSTWDNKSNTMTQSLLAIPLMLGENMMGVLQVTNKKQGSGFTDFDEKNLKGIGDALAVALSHLKNSPKSPLGKFSYLLDNNILTPQDLKTATAAAKKRSVLVETELLENLKLSRKKIGKSLEQYYGKPYTGYDSSVDLPPQVFSGLNKNYLSRNNWVPIKNSPKSAVILVDDPSDMDKIRNIRMIFPKKAIEFHVSLREDILDFLNHASGLEDLPDDETHAEEMSSLLTALQDEESMASLDDAPPVDDDVNSITETDSTIVRLVNKVLTDAYDKGISDIHIEPGIGKKDMRVRFRKDGICQVYQNIPFKYKQAIISRLKIMAKLDIAERRMPQDGKIKMRYGRKEIEYRVATCPTVGGNEDAVLRILADSKPIPLKGMKFSDNNLKLIEETAQKPYGLILVVGPTGSGKTTTLHSCLGHINTDDRKIWTAEDPVEITQDGLRQVQMLNKIGLNFARAMRSFLRGDPDVIMVGEMRDTETASIGLEASLTGHLVMSTLHTNSAPETIVRLLDMGMNPLNFADALLLIVAQRLVRTLCKECKVAYNPTSADFDIIVREYGEEAFAKNLGIEYSADLNLYKPAGCSKCGDTGYAGRMALHELLSATKEMKRKIMDNNKVEELRSQAISDGMTTLKQDGIDKIFQGYCDLKQVLAVCIA